MEKRKRQNNLRAQANPEALVAGTGFDFTRRPTMTQKNLTVTRSVTWQLGCTALRKDRLRWPVQWSFTILTLVCCNTIQFYGGHDQYLRANVPGWVVACRYSLVNRSVHNKAMMMVHLGAQWWLAERRGAANTVVKLERLYWECIFISCETKWND